MFYLKFFIACVILLQVNAQMGRKLGDDCIPGTCSTVNSNCKWQGTSFKCVCKEKYMQINNTHCGRHLTNVEEPKCKECLERDSLCLDFDNDGKTDDCWCPKNETCGVISQSNAPTRQAMKVLKNVEVAMILLDVINNRPILDGSTVFVGDKVLIDIKASLKDPSVSMSIENCSISALTNADDIFIERIDLIKRGCTVHNDVIPFNINFRPITDMHVESNVFDIFKLRSSSLALINCWVQFCVQKTKCAPRVCMETNVQENHQLLNNQGIHAANILMRNLVDNDNSHYAQSDSTIFRDAGVRIIVEDPYGIQAARSMKTEANSANTIELEIKTRTFSGIVKTVLVTVIALVFAIIVSVCSILVYRSCTRDQMMHHPGAIETPISICQPSEDCKYDMNAKNLEESFFQNPVEPLAAQSHGSRW